MMQTDFFAAAMFCREGYDKIARSPARPCSDRKWPKRARELRGGVGNDRGRCSKVRKVDVGVTRLVSGRGTQKDCQTTDLEILSRNFNALRTRDLRPKQIASRGFFCVWKQWVGDG